MIQFNLLPDVKLQYIKAQRLKRLVIVMSTLVSGVCLAVFIVLFLYVRVSQKQEIADLTDDINKSKSTLQQAGIGKVLTIQNQLTSLSNLHGQKVISSRLFGYLTKVTPSQATISTVNVDFLANTMSIQGNADSLPTINKFVDTLKFTEYPSAEKDENGNPILKRAFKNVVLANYSIGGDKAGESARLGYTINFVFEPVIFANIKPGSGQPDIELTVPQITTTQSETGKPHEVFAPQVEEVE